MRNLLFLFTALFIGTTSILANTADDKVATRNAYQNNNSFIFVENGITFSVFPDGEFDFYIDNYVNNRNNRITFNSGHNYSAYAQYDDYGAVIQIENVPIYYDTFGRVSHIGNIDIAYRHGRVFRLGNMNVYYNHNGYYDYHTGYINVYNRRYVYRPFHRFFLRPSLGLCLVFNKPYRRYYNPHRYTYFSPYTHNRRHVYAKFGREHRYNNVRRERASIYRNDRRVSVRKNRAQRSNTVARTNRTVRKGNAVNRSNNTSSRQRYTTRNNKIAGRTVATRTKQPNRKITRGASTNYSKRTVTRTPNRTITRNTNVYRTPRSNTSNSNARKANVRSRTTVTKRSTPQRNRVSRAPSKSRTSARTPSSRNSSRNSKASSSRSISRSSKATSSRSSRRN